MQKPGGEEGLGTRLDLPSGEVLVITMAAQGGVRWSGVVQLMESFSRQLLQALFNCLCSLWSVGV